jgi:beta-N-acetylhexosaminidase
MGCTRDATHDLPDDTLPPDPAYRAQEDRASPAEGSRERAARLASSLDDRLLTAQVLMSGIDGKAPALPEDMQALLAYSPVGGIMLFKYNLDTEKGAIRAFLDRCSADIAAVFAQEGVPLAIPPFIAVDHEGGAVHRFGPEVGRLPEPAWFWDLAQNQGRDYALRELEAQALRSGKEIHALGITMNFAPVAETLDEENRSFLEARSYGPDPSFTGPAVQAFIRGMEGAGVACVVKHFPGNTGTDPHKARAVLPADRQALKRMTRTFAEAVRDSRPSGIMVSHIVVPAWDQRRNASLSPRVIREWLRGELGFTGIVMGDDFTMAAVADSGLPLEAAVVEALNAGLDMVMTWPRNLRSVHQAILTALKEGRLPRERLKEAVERILFEKIRYGLIEEHEDGL